ncbi:hypothetical protein AB0F72_22040 [Actinoplanes sp. NPDC023936]|uniref:hypothetical protein n=1 Tax=Actinoplanes sp. NPDC023936 TaxID=3154910 RepID=UPI0033FB539B
MIHSWWPGRPSVPAVQPSPPGDAIRAAAEQAARGGWEAVERLATLLAELADTGSAEAGRAALSVLHGRPRAVVRLDEHARRAWWYEIPLASLARRVAGRVADGAATAPVAVALASTHGDGRVRERAVAAMLAAPAPELMPFLVLRTSDWARPVRDRARAGLALLLADDPAAHLPVVLPAVTAIERRLRGTFAAGQVTAALATASPGLRRAVAALPHPASRRLVHDIGLSWGWWSPDEVIELAESGADVRIRSRAAELACRDAVWRRRQAVLHRLAGSSRPEVRAAALTGLVRTGDDAAVVAHLADRAPLVRALARDAARRAGADAPGRYREAVLTTPTPPWIAGFAETASAEEAPLLEPLLGHADAKVRAAAVRGLRDLGAVSPAGMIPMLRDPSAAVVREAVGAVRPIVNAIPADLLWNLLADSRTELRRAGLRLLSTGPARARLRAGLIAVTDTDPRLAARVRADLTRLSRDATGPS